MTLDQLIERLRSLEARFFGADYVRELDEQNAHEETEQKSAKSEPSKGEK